jgi:tetratricopeptide (TPR) repeat protein
MSARIAALLVDLRRSTGDRYLEESVELGDNEFVRTHLEASWASADTVAQRLMVARIWLLLDREEAVRRAESVDIEDEEQREELAEFWRIANTKPAVETAEQLAATEAVIERERRMGSYWNRMIELAEAYVQVGAFDDARGVVTRYDERDRPRRREADDDLRLAPVYITLARIMLDANDPQRAVKLVHDICDVGRDSSDPKLVARAALAFALFGERDEAARLADLATSDDADVLVDLVEAWIAIDRTRSYDRAYACVQPITRPYRRATALLALARYAFRIDHGGHVPLPDDAPQPPPRARLLDGSSMVPVPRVRMR